MAASPRELEQLRKKGLESEGNRFAEMGLPPSLALSYGSLENFNASRIQKGQQPAKPSVKQVMDTMGVDAYTAGDLLYGVVGANQDTRDFSGIMSAADPLLAAREATREMYESGSVRPTAELMRQGGGDYVQSFRDIQQGNYNQLAPNVYADAERAYLSAPTPYGGDILLTSMGKYTGPQQEGLRAREAARMANFGYNPYTMQPVSDGTRDFSYSGLRERGGLPTLLELLQSMNSAQSS